MAMKAIGLSALLLSLTACKPLIDYAPPPGFAQAESDWREHHYKGSNDVGLRVTVFDNVEGGTLGYWGDDLEHKLTERGYALEKKAPLRSENKVSGVRYDFRLEAGMDDPMFLVVGLFVTDDYRYVTQLAGRHSELADYDARVAGMFESLLPQGCAPRSRICRQPPP